MSDLTGTTLGRYQIRERLGSDDQSKVYKATQTASGRLVAVKVFEAGPAASPSREDQFRQKAQALADLHHPNIVPVLDYGTQGSLYYVVMAYTQGRSLAQELQEAQQAGRRLGPERIGQIIAATGSALAYAHEQGILHLDVKPSN